MADRAGARGVRRGRPELRELLGGPGLRPDRAEALGIGPELLNPEARTREVRNWLRGLTPRG